MESFFFFYKNLIVEDLFTDAHESEYAFWSCKEVHLISLGILKAYVSPKLKEKTNSTAGLVFYKSTQTD